MSSHIIKKPYSKTVNAALNRKKCVVEEEETTNKAIPSIHLQELQTELAKNNIILFEFNLFNILVE